MQGLKSPCSGFRVWGLYPNGGMLSYFILGSIVSPQKDYSHWNQTVYVGSALRILQGSHLILQTPTQKPCRGFRV